MKECEQWLIEEEYFGKGYKLICGVDEAGRGPLAGPVCAAAVILPPGLTVKGLDDSKKVGEKQRERLFDLIVESAVTYNVAFASVSEIERLNILGAALLAMNRAIAGLDPAPDIALIDGNINKGIEVNSIPITGGDGKSASIAAASILAKVSRDRYMYELAKKYPEYGFERHKGYGTKLHYELLREHGPCGAHRPSFLRKLS